MPSFARGGIVSGWRGRWSDKAKVAAVWRGTVRIFNHPFPNFTKFVFQVVRHTLMFSFILLHLGNIILKVCRPMLTQMFTFTSARRWRLRIDLGHLGLPKLGLVQCCCRNVSTLSLRPLWKATLFSIDPDVLKWPIGICECLSQVSIVVVNVQVDVHVLIYSGITSCSTALNASYRNFAKYSLAYMISCFQYCCLNSCVIPASTGYNSLLCASARARPLPSPAGNHPGYVSALSHSPDRDHIRWPYPHQSGWQVHNTYIDPSTGLYYKIADYVTCN